MKNIFFIFSIVFIVLILFPLHSSVVAEEYEKICVPTGEVAVEIAKIVMKAVFPYEEINYDSISSVYYYSSRDEWEVVFKWIDEKRNVPEHLYGYVVGGTGPFVCIKRTNATVTAVYLGGK